ncbi:MAG: hypothetical protein ACTHOG_13960 [Marmoricola sp.]
MDDPGASFDDVAPTGVPSEYGDAYQRAYRWSLAEHATELMSAARPGKRARRRPGSWRVRERAERVIASVLADPVQRALAGGFVVVALLVAAYGAGRLFR